MIAQIRAELLKIRSTRATIGLIALILLFTLLTGLLTHPSGLASKEDQRQLLSLSSLAGVFSALAGVLLVTSETASARSVPRSYSTPSAHTSWPPRSSPAHWPESNLCYRSEEMHDDPAERHFLFASATRYARRTWHRPRPCHYGN